MLRPVDHFLAEGECIMNKEIPPRRVVMRAALAAGCSLWMPIALSADDPKKGSSSPAAQAATKKTPQASVQYQTKPKGDQKCSACLNFIAGTNTCKVVEGQISAEGWCSLWVKKS
jgi:hypothetical protein